MMFVMISLLLSYCQSNGALEWLKGDELFQSAGEWGTLICITPSWSYKNVYIFSILLIDCILVRPFDNIKIFIPLFRFRLGGAHL